MLLYWLGWTEMVAVTNITDKSGLASGSFYVWWNSFLVFIKQAGNNFKRELRANWELFGNWGAWYQCWGREGDDLVFRREIIVRKNFYWKRRFGFYWGNILWCFLLIKICYPSNISKYLCRAGITHFYCNTGGRCRGKQDCCTCLSCWISASEDSVF